MWLDDTLTANRGTPRWRRSSKRSFPRWTETSTSGSGYGGVCDESPPAEIYPDRSNALTRKLAIWALVS